MDTRIKTITHSDGTTTSVGVISTGGDSAEYKHISGIMAKLRKAVDPPAESRQDDGIFVNEGIHPHPFDMLAAKELVRINPQHSTCISVKRDATVGLGFDDPQAIHQADIQLNPENPMLVRGNPVETKVDRALDPLCDDSFQDVLNDVAEDFWATGQGYIEVVREVPTDVTSRITGLYHIPSECVEVYKWGGHRYHYQVNQDGHERNWPRFGRVKQFLVSSPLLTNPIAKSDVFSEVIPFRFSSSQDPYYGVPTWLSAVPDIELLSGLRQYLLDFFHNRGVPEYVLLYKGHMSPEAWNNFTSQLRDNVGLGNAHKSLALKSENQDTDIQIIRLGIDSFNGEEQFKDMRSSSELSIVTAHRVSPLLAGIQIPGKLGAANEFPQQLTSFQTLLIDHAQRKFQRVLGQTLGNPKYNGGIPLASSDFQLRRITDIIDPAVMDTMARMRQSPQGAVEEGRDMKAGPKD